MKTKGKAMSFTMGMKRLTFVNSGNLSVSAPLDKALYLIMQWSLINSISTLSK